MKAIDSFIRRQSGWRYAAAVVLIALPLAIVTAPVMAFYCEVQAHREMGPE